MNSIKEITDREGKIIWKESKHCAGFKTSN